MKYNFQNNDLTCLVSLKNILSYASLNYANTKNEQLWEVCKQNTKFFNDISVIFYHEKIWAIFFNCPSPMEGREAYPLIEKPQFSWWQGESFVEVMSQQELKGLGKQPGGLAESTPFTMLKGLGKRPGGLPESTPFTMLKGLGKRPRGLPESTPFSMLKGLGKLWSCWELPVCAPSTSFGRSLVAAFWMLLVCARMLQVGILERDGLCLNTPHK